MKNSKSRALLYLSIVGFAVMSLTFLLMPIGASGAGVTPFRAAIGGAFWLGLILGIVSQIMLTLELKKQRDDKAGKRRNIGLITFLSNPLAAAADALMVLSFILLIISLFFQNAFGYFNYIIWFAFTFSLSMHCILNGKNYYKIKRIEKRSVRNEEIG